MDRSQANAHIAQFGQLLGLSELSLDEGGVCMVALGDDDLAVTLGLDAGGALRIMICLDDVTPVGGQIAELLTANFSTADTDGGAFALTPETGALVLLRRCGVEDFQSGGLAAVVAGLAGAARRWRTRLQAGGVEAPIGRGHAHFPGERA